jgi:hypothetical protein
VQEVHKPVLESKVAQDYETFSQVELKRYCLLPQINGFCRQSPDITE